MTIADMKTTTAENIIKVSFMVFRTGSVLIVGRCNRDILSNIYDMLCCIFTAEYKLIHEPNVIAKSEGIKQKRNSKVKHIIVNSD
jgi:hypothetical protein